MVINIELYNLDLTKEMPQTITQKLKESVKKVKKVIDKATEAGKKKTPEKEKKS